MTGVEFLAGAMMVLVLFTQWIPDTLTAGLKQLRCEADHSPPYI
jgi:hypothetical protein